MSNQGTFYTARWTVRGNTRPSAKGPVTRGVTHVVSGPTPYAARRAWANVVRESGALPMMPSTSSTLIESGQ